MGALDSGPAAASMSQADAHPRYDRLVHPTDHAPTSTATPRPGGLRSVSGASYSPCDHTVLNNRDDATPSFKELRLPPVGRGSRSSTHPPSSVSCLVHR
jgi:hypothetical protein